jgi:hypothetical protein
VIPELGCIIARRKYEGSTGLNIHEIYSVAGSDRQAARIKMFSRDSAAKTKGTNTNGYVSG